MQNRLPNSQTAIHRQVNRQAIFVVTVSTLGAIALGMLARWLV